MMCVPKAISYEAYQIGSDGEQPEWVESVMASDKDRSYQVVLATGTRMVIAGDWCVKLPLGIAVLSDSTFNDMFSTCV